MFNKEIAEQHLNKLLKQYKIKVVKWSTTSSGCAWVKKKEIKIPKPTNPDRFGVCCHEVKHIIDGDIVNGKKAKRFEQEFACDMFAREQMVLIDTGGIAEWDNRTNWHCLSRIAMAVNRGLNINKIGKEIREWFYDVDFEKWVGKKIFVQRSKANPKGYTIEYTVNLNKWEVEMLLNRKGLMIEKSDRDDSTYGNWIVRDNGEKYGSEFQNLSEIVRRYELEK